MIQSLSIRNVALIEQLTIQFHSGLQVLSGETGAGKSIVVDAVNLVLGGRAERTMIRTGCSKASVEAIFDVPDFSAAYALLEREGIETEGGTVSIYREISDNGKNICRVCGVIMPVSFLKELAPTLMNLYGQSEHQYLTDPQTHLRYLDQIGDEEHRRRIDETRISCAAFISNHRSYARLVKRNEEKDERMSRITRDLEELRMANLQSGEEETLRSDLKRLDKAGKITEGLKRAYRRIMAGDDENGALQALQSAAKDLRSITVYDDQAEALAEKCEELYYELEELTYRINSLIDQNDYEPGRLERTEERLDLIRRIEKKFGATVEDVLEKEHSLEEEYQELCGLDDLVKQTGAEHKKLLGIYRSAARELTDSRKKLARSFSENMMRELKDLGMEQTVFDVRFSENRDGKPKMPTENGDDEAEFMISPNPGEPLMPMARIASGGELSRLMLAMKTLEAGHTGVDCMVFDEIDTGISGKTAQTVAEKMIAISRYHQVICVSHLPQLAAAGDYQYLVSKHVEDGRTVTQVTELDRDGRIGEIARMISGADGISVEASTYAENMIAAAEKLKHTV